MTYNPISVKLTRYKYQSPIWVVETGANALVYIFDPKPSKIDKQEAVEWRIRHSGKSREPKARWRRRQTIKYILSGGMAHAEWKKTDDPGNPGFEDVLLYRGNTAYAYKFECDLVPPGKTIIVVVEKAVFSQDTTKTLDTGEPWFSYKVDLNKIQHG